MILICEKLLLISKLNNLSNNFVNMERIVNKVNTNYNMSEINNNSVKEFKISVECNAFDVNEDKQRQCYKQLKCFWPKCRYISNYESDLNRHIVQHLNKRQFVCEECNKQYNWSSILKQHKRLAHSNVRPLVCSESNCQKSFKFKELLKRHLKTHSTERSFKCDECDKRFHFKGRLLIHKRIHSKLMPFICDAIGCDRRFKSLISLKEHKIRFHFGIKSYKCFHNNCDKSFVTSGELKKHIAYRHSNDRPYKCQFPQCSSSFKTSNNLYKHNKIHNK